MRNWMKETMSEMSWLWKCRCGWRFLINHVVIMKTFGLSMFIEKPKGSLGPPSQTYQASHIHTNFVQKLVFIDSYKNHMNFMLRLIWMIFGHIKYFKYLNGWNIVFKLHTWMFMLWKLHSFIQNYITIITHI